MLYLVSRINSLYLFVNLLSVSLFLTHLFLRLSLLLQSSVDLTLSSSLTNSLFHSKLKTHLFHKSFPPQTHLFPPNCFHGLLPRPFLQASRFCLLDLSHFSVLVPIKIRLSWLFYQLLSARK